MSGRKFWNKEISLKVTYGELRNALEEYCQHLYADASLSARLFSELEERSLPILMFQILLVREFNQDEEITMGNELLLVSRIEESKSWLYLVPVNRGVWNPFRPIAEITLDDLSQVEVPTIDQVVAEIVDIYEMIDDPDSIIEGLRPDL